MSDPVYIKRGVAFSDSISYQLTSGVFQTGKSQANFTILLSRNGTGGQLTTGITLTEVSAGSNPGDYILAYAASAFVAADGEYHLVVYDTATPAYSWHAVYVVTPTGLPGTTSDVFFTSTAANGRAVDTAGNPLSGVVIYIKSGAVVLSPVTTDVNGNFTFFAPAGVWTLYYTLSGYQQATSSVTFTTTTATGPGTDVALTSVNTGGTVYASDLWTYCRQQSFDQNGTQADQKIKRAVNRALDMVAKERTFNWWLRRESLVIYGALTYTITLTKGSATAASTSGAFPSWATNLARFNTNSQILDIISQTNTTNVVLRGNWNGATGSYSATLFKDTYDLPDNMFQFGRVLPGQRWGWGGDPVSAEVVWECQNAAAYQQQGPSLFAIYNGNLILGPYPSADQTYLYTYHARPTPLVNAGDIADFDGAQIEIVHRAIDVQTAMEFGKAVAGDVPACMRAYKDALARMVTTDKSTADLPGLGGMGGRQPPYWKAPRAP
jgi:hypothetical protein